MRGFFFFFFSSRRRHTRLVRDWSSDVCSSDLALVNAMNTGMIGGTALDTVDAEPLPENSPLWDLPNTIITPHVAAFTDGVANEMANF